MLVIYRVTTVILFFIFATSTFSEDMYKWIDPNGNINFTNKPALIPKEEREKAEIIEGKLKPDHGDNFTVLDISPAPTEDEEETPSRELGEDGQKEQALRELWRSQALEIENQERAIIQERDKVETQIGYKKKEVDYLLINGYFADRSIRQLRYLENYLQELNSQIILLRQERQNLADDARRQGIPPGYLRR